MMESLAVDTPGVPAPAFPTIDPNLVVEYVASLLEITLGATRSDLEKNGSLLSKTLRDETLRRVVRFATEAQLALYIQKDIAPVEVSLDRVIDPSGQQPLPLPMGSS
jgi:dynein heavy chain 1